MKNIIRSVINVARSKKNSVTKFINHRNALSLLKDKSQITCVFLATFDSTWKYDNLYKKMLSDNRFNPIIVICPVVNLGHKNMLERIIDCEHFFQSKGYEFINSYNKDTNEYIDLKKQLNPDILFYTNPYQGLIDDRYYIDQFRDTLTCYVPYFFASVNDPMFYNLPFHHMLWRYYVENESVKNEYQVRLRQTYKNAVCVGYSVFDEFKNVCKESEPNKRKMIIWAPHHLIEPLHGILRDGFMSLYDKFFEIADYYNGRIEFVFRPHPLLKSKLYDHKDWGKVKTDEYYSKWATYPNCRIEEKGSYINLFNESDAMIHNCGSFMGEYIYVNKPVLFTDKIDFCKDQYLEVGQESSKCHYFGFTKDDIIKFIDDCVLGNYDYKKDLRQNFIDGYIHAEWCVADNIITDIIESIQKQKV